MIPVSVRPWKRALLHVRIVEANHCVVLTRDAACAIVFKIICRKNAKRHADFVKSVCHWYILVVKIMLVYPEQNVETAVF